MSAAEFHRRGLVLQSRNALVEAIEKKAHAGRSRVSAEGRALVEDMLQDAGPDGLDFQELEERSGMGRRLLLGLVGGLVSRGRVVLGDDGNYRLAPSLPGFG